jgi:uncharacterized protein DUF3187
VRRWISAERRGKEAGDSRKKAGNRWITVCCALLSIAVAHADAELDQPLALSDRQPLVQLYNLPAARSGAIVTDDRTNMRLGFDVANNFTSSQRGSETVFLDGESRRLELGATRGLGNGWEVGFSLPWISYSGGSLDNFIEGWHRTFGLPDGDRSKYRRNQLRFQYQRAGLSELDIGSAESGIGDLQLNAAYSLSSTTNSAVALAAAINLPTGDADKLTGADATDLSVTLAATRYALFDLPLTATVNIGSMWLDRGAVLGDRQKSNVWFGAAEIGWAVADAWRLKAQLAAHSAFYRSDLRELGAASAQLLLGGSVRLSPRYWLDVAVGEDIAVNTAPDVTLQVALKAAW